MSKKTTEVADKPRSKTERKKAIPPEGIRCTHMDGAGRQCRSLALRSTGARANRGKGGLCVTHATEERQLMEYEEVAIDLLASAEALDTSLGVNQFLDKLLKLTIADQIPMRKAALLTYQASLLLTSTNGVRTELKGACGERGLNALARLAFLDIYGIGEEESKSDSKPDARLHGDPEQASEPISDTELVSQ
jgi:hypothetical protein